DFALVDEAFFVAVQELDGVFDGDNVVGAGGVDAVNDGCEGGGLTGTGGSGDEHQAALLFADFVDHRRKIQLFGGADFCGNDAQDHADVPALLENVHAETSEARHAVSHIQFRRFLELLLLAVGHHAESHRKHFFRRNAGYVGERGEQAIDAQIRVVSDFKVQVGRFAFDSAAQKIVNADVHIRVNPERMQL